MRGKWYKVGIVDGRLVLRRVFAIFVGSSVNNQTKTN